MATTILRFEKLKTKTNIHMAGAHQHRFSNTPNANPELSDQNKILIGSNNITKDVEGLISHYKIKPRKNAVLAMDTLLTLSPELLCSKGDVVTFQNTAKDWLKQRFGTRCVSAVLHMDETTPHIHAVIVPLSKNKAGKVRLNARDLFNPIKLSAYQREFNSYMKDVFPTILPPQHGRKTSHKKIKAFYEELENDAKLLKEKQLKVYELELKKQQKALIQKFIERCIPALTIWANKLECELRKEVGDYSTKLSIKYKNRSKKLQFELEETFEQNPELLDLKNKFENKFI
ncbi:plasmid recombination protein [Shewanella gelidimarina]|uniref:MobV family relaxase n=1 Tax=Shewanella gelidimarina TaxID=56813 RepID=UPI00200DBA7F|nr:MobV family relaxase [Shewanella gelidimarina]MCL1059740.1 plasmid recombination protein [Shewanella gelidimarina]